MAATRRGSRKVDTHEDKVELQRAPAMRQIGEEEEEEGYFLSDQHIQSDSSATMHFVFKESSDEQDF
jgi:hypothetical protein